MSQFRNLVFDAADVRTTDFDLPKAKVNALTDNGQAGMTKYFEWFNDLGTDLVPLNRI